MKKPLGMYRKIIKTVIQERKNAIKRMANFNAKRATGPIRRFKNPVGLKSFKDPNRKVFSAREKFPVSCKLKNLHFIHIGKCGGTAIHRSFLEAGLILDETHMRPAPLEPNNYMIWVRDPAKRFVSAFNHSKNIVAFDTTHLNPKNLTLENCPAPGKIAQKMRTGFAFSEEYEFLLSKFQSANDLAEALYCGHPIKRFHAHMLMRYPDQHLRKGIGWYLYNGAWVKRYRRNIMFVGTLESISTDFTALKDTINAPENVALLKIRENKGEFDKTLSETALRNIRKFYKNTDYKALAALKKHGFLGEDITY